jgi:acyl-CoA synthetase (AMP-forming)/AMP-acid ligase II
MSPADSGRVTTGSASLRPLAAVFTVATLARRGMLTPGSPARVAAQLNALRTWGFSLAGELRQAAARSPRRIALIDEHRGEITYGGLLDAAERTARTLRAAGAGPGDRVGVLCRNHAGAIEVMVGACLLGADAVLVNTGLSAAQLGTVTDEQRLQVLVHDDEFTPVLSTVPAVVRRLDEHQLAEAVARAAPGAVRRPDRDGRTIVLTSGTTGTPKGARRRTPGGFGPLVSIIDRIPLRAGDRILIAAPLFHTWGYAALQVSFALRATVVLQRRFDPIATHGALVRHRCDALFAVPVMLQRMLDAVFPTASLARSHEPSVARPPLRVAAVSGSALPGGLATRFMDAYGDVLYNLYGSTEASWVSIATPSELRRAPNTAGRPPYGTRLAIFDREGVPVPAGDVGRIFVGNDMIFEGYTSGAARESRDGMLATGDVGHVEDGLLFIDGREDDMIVSGGENVFPSEVEDLLARLPQVREAAVVGVADQEYGHRLAAFLALHPGERLDEDAVRGYVRHHLARFCVPRDVYFLDALPRNATGKVLTRDLLWWLQR